MRAAATESESAARAIVFVALRDNAARVDAVRAVFTTRGVVVDVARVVALRDCVVVPARVCTGCEAVRVRTWGAADGRVDTDCARVLPDVCVVLVPPRVDVAVCPRSLLPVADFTDKFVARETDCVFDVDSLDADSDDFWRCAVTVLFDVRRTAARAASVLSSAIAPQNVSGARHTAKSSLSPFIPYVEC